MKLIYCKSCHDIRKLHITEVTYCLCRKSSGVYLDSINAIISGDQVVLLGIANTSLINALDMTRDEDLLGQKFNAFVIPENVPAIRRVDCIKEPK